jgi:putative glutamine amidotransferase
MRVPYYDAGRVAEFCAGVATGKAPARKRHYRLVAVPDYCFTNGVTVVKANIVDAPEKAGFFPYVIPFTADDKALAGYIMPADALLVAGGFRLQDYKKRCDFEIRAIRIALDRAMPIAGVCHGCQVINVAFGGTLAHTPQSTGVENPQILHRRQNVVPWTDNYHAAETVAGSRIAAVLGTGTVVVNSSHSRCIGKPAPGIKVTARAPDGVVEAIEHETLPVMAFQFHPERMAFDERMVNLIRTALKPRCSASASMLP